MNATFGQPMLPRGIMHAMEDLHAAEPSYNAGNGGQWESGDVVRVPFEGAVLPVSEDDWRKAPQGTYTKNSRKIYTNGHELRVGAQVYDPQDGATYTVTGDLNYGSIHPMRRFSAERKEVTAAK